MQGLKQGCLQALTNASINDKGLVENKSAKDKENEVVWVWVFSMISLNQRVEIKKRTSIRRNQLSDTMDLLGSSYDGL